MSHKPSQCVFPTYFRPKDEIERELAGLRGTRLFDFAQSISNEALIYAWLVVTAFSLGFGFWTQRGHWKDWLPHTDRGLVQFTVQVMTAAIGLFAMFCSAAIMVLVVFGLCVFPLIVAVAAVVHFAKLIFAGPQ